MSASAILNEQGVRAALRLAWFESEPGLTNAHEEGGFILRDEAGKILIARWPRGGKSTILIPPHENCLLERREIIATFHTHPNTGPDYLQEPCEADRRAVRDDADLKGASYIGELVISEEVIYLIAPTGEVSKESRTWEALSEE